jgi:23S rRNA pseudouridine1911/1915/1917 synthase
MATRARAPSRPQAEVAVSDSVALLTSDAMDEEWGDDEVLPLASVAPIESETRVLRVGKDAHGQRLDAFLAAQVPAYSRSHLKNLIEEGCVLVDAAAQTSPSRKVAAGQSIQVELKPTAQSQAFVAEVMDLPIVFEDEHLMVINKPAGLVVHPAAGNWTGTLMNGLLAHHAGAASLPRAGIVHRLDKDTSGLMVVGKTLLAVTALSRAIAAREVSRQYLALVHGEVPAAMTVESSIGRDPVTRIKMAVVPSGKPARTDVKRLLLARWAPAPVDAKSRNALPDRAFSGVLCTLHTGRTHQIRVHLSSRRFPLVADVMYGGGAALGMARQALHAARLSFDHPHTHQRVTFEAPLPEDMAAAWAALEAGLASPTHISPTDA